VRSKETHVNQTPRIVRGKGTQVNQAPRIVRGKRTHVNQAPQREQKTTTSTSLFLGNAKISAKMKSLVFV